MDDDCKNIEIEGWYKAKLKEIILSSDVSMRRSDHIYDCKKMNASYEIEWKRHLKKWQSALMCVTTQSIAFQWIEVLNISSLQSC